MRTRKRTTNRASYGQASLTNALKAVQSGMTLYKASKEWGVPRKTLRRHRDGKVQDPGHLGRGTDIPRSLEDALVNKVKEMERLLFGLTTEDVRRSRSSLHRRRA